MLDGVLSAAVLWARQADPAAASDRWRGLYLDQATAEALAAGGGPLAGLRGTPAPLAAACLHDHGFALLRTMYGLSDFELASVALTAAAELDARYGRVFGFLHDDVTRRLPTPSLAIGLFSDGAAERDVARRALTSGALLARERILHAEAPENEPLLIAPLRLDPQIRQLLLNEPGVDPRLASFCTLRAPRPQQGTLAPEAAARLHAAAERMREGRRLRIALAGPSGCGQDEAADLLAEWSGHPLLCADLRAFPHASGDPALLLALLRREALLADAVVRIDNAETLAPELHPLLEAELPRIAPALVVATPPGSWLVPAAARAGLAPVAFDPPDAVLRARCWRDGAAAHGIALDATDA
ncbi:MAG: hypothetical protein JSR21_04385, partial [Proteobacteria bacterium]|nr:hypothetical protein [Pseudomonadota bacterium]